MLVRAIDRPSPAAHMARGSTRLMNACAMLGCSARVRARSLSLTKRESIWCGSELFFCVFQAEKVSCRVQPYSALIRHDSDALQVDTDENLVRDAVVRDTEATGCTSSDLRQGNVRVGFEEVLMWAEAVTVGAVQQLDCQPVWRAQTGNSAALSRIAERLSAAADAVRANGLRRALSRVRGPMRVDGTSEQQVINCVKPSRRTERK